MRPFPPQTCDTCVHARKFTLTAPPWTGRGPILCAATDDDAGRWRRERTDANFHPTRTSPPCPGWTERAPGGAET